MVIFEKLFRLQFKFMEIKKFSTIYSVTENMVYTHKDFICVFSTSLRCINMLYYLFNTNGIVVAGANQR